MDQLSSNLNLNWINFIEHFCANQTNFSFTEKENGYLIYSIENIFDTNIDLSSQYGFLNLTFQNKTVQDNFLQFVKIHKEETKSGDIRLISTYFPAEDFPARVYPNRLKLSFYDRDNTINDSEKFENRIKVFQNIIFALLQLKIINIRHRFVNL